MSSNRIIVLDDTLSECGRNIDNLLESMRKLKEIVSTIDGNDNNNNIVGMKLYNLKCEEIALWITECMFTFNNKNK